MKIGLSTTTLELASAGGIFDGISHYTQQLGHGLLRRGVAVKNYAFPHALARIGKGLQFSEPIRGGFTLLGGAGIATGGAAQFFSPAVDVFHSTDFKVVPAKCPVVATIWDAIPIVHPEWISARARLVAPYAIKRVAHFADRIICTTEHSAADIVRHFGMPPGKISIVPWGVGAEWLTPVPQAEVDAVLAKYELLPGYFLTVGTIQPRKNIRRLLEAYMLLPASVRNDHKLVVVGREGWGSEDALGLLKELVGAGRATWLSDVASDQELRALYQAAHVFILPSLYEGFGIPLLEAFASSVPVVTSNATSLPEVSAGAAFEVDPLYVEEISAAILSLATSASDRRERTRLGRARAEHLSIDRAVEHTIDVYDLAKSDR